jgi:hypothetical protein
MRAAAMTTYARRSPTSCAIGTAQVSGCCRREGLAEREAELLPVPYFHVVYTLPAPIADMPIRTRP